jgi:hypothetical protein
MSNNPPLSYGSSLPSTTLDSLLGFLELEEGYGETQRGAGRLYVIGGDPTIGYGFDLTQKNVLGAVLDVMTGSYTISGVNYEGNVFAAAAAFATAAKTTISAASLVNYFEFIVRSSANASTVEGYLSGALQQIFAGGTPYVQVNGQYQLPQSSSNPTFSFPASNLQLAQQVLTELITGATLDEGAAGLISVVGYSPAAWTALTSNGAAVDSNGNIIGAAPDSQQWIALVANQFNGLTRHTSVGFKYNDPAQTWYYLRYTNNLAISSGVAKRNYLQSTMFGLNGGASTVTSTLALQDFEMLAEHRTTIINFEQTYGPNPDGPDPLYTARPGAWVNANADIARMGTYTYDSALATAPSSLALPGEQALTLAAAFNPAAAVIASTINSTYGNWIDSVGIAGVTSGAFSVRSTDIVVAPDAQQYADNFVTNTSNIFEALDSPLANHIFIGPDTTSSNASDELIGGDGNDLFIAGAGSEVLDGRGSGDDTFIGGETAFDAGPVLSDTLVGNAGNDTFLLQLPNASDLTEVIEQGTSSSGAVDVLTGTGSSAGVVTLHGSSLTPTLSANGQTLTWSADSSADTSGVSYVYDKTTGSLTVSGGILGEGAGANSIIIQGFNLEAATQGGSLGISLQKSAFLNFQANTGIDPAAPDFDAASTQSYTFSTTTASSDAQTVTVSLGGENASDFSLSVAGEPIAANENGSFSFTLPAGQTSVAFSLTNTADVGSSGTLQLSATLSNPDNTMYGPAISNTISQNFVEPSTDPFVINTTAAVPGQTIDRADGVDYTYYSGNQITDQGQILNESVTATSGINWIDITTAPPGINQPSDLILGGDGENTISVGAGNNQIYSGPSATDLDSAVAAANSGSCAAPP